LFPFFGISSGYISHNYLLIREKMKTKLLKNQAFLAIVIIAFVQYSCQKSSTTTSASYAVKLATSSTLGNYLVDKNGSTLYFFSNDYNGRTSCLTGCETLWPYFYAGELTQADLGTGLDIADFDTIQVNGVAQTRYKTWPLYYYAPAGSGGNVKEAAGQTGGEGMYNVWYVAKPDYSIMLENAQLVGNDGIDYTSDYTPGTGKTLYFTDARGVALYSFTKDSANMNKFTKADFSNNSFWPIYETTLGSVPSTLDKSLFSSITVFGHTQITYKGWPLYYFGADNATHGDNKGVSVPTPGIWHVAVKDASSAPAVNNGGGGGGGGGGY
jgi:predicted lipoprotein with Yx(FWY)xxD motif